MMKTDMMMKTEERDMEMMKTEKREMMKIDMMMTIEERDTVKTEERDMEMIDTMMTEKRDTMMTEKKGYGDDRKKGYGERRKHHEAPAIESAKVFKVCTYVNPAATQKPTCGDDEGSCLLVENAKCYTTIFGTSLQINLVGETATILYFPGSTSCTTVAGHTTGIYNNVVLDTCVVDADPTGAALQTLGWKVSRIRF